MKKLVLLILFIVSWTPHVKAEDLSINGLMAGAKMSGGCGIIKQMFQFQDATQMPGGEEFIMRFLNTEYARLELSQSEYFELCVKSNEMYQEMVNLNSKDGQK